MSYLTQMLGLSAQNFVSAAAGMAVLVAFIRGITRHTTKSIGNFWVDLTRSTLYILLPLSIVLALALVSQGVVQTFSEYKNVNGLQTSAEQNLPLGPAASQIAIKQLGTYARAEIERFVQTKVFLELTVKVRDNWRDDERALQMFGYGGG